VNEFELIALLTRAAPGNRAVITGPGDDCAVLDLGVPGRFVLFKTDAVVEGIHFTREAAPRQVGHKALGRALSDMAAMAGQPIAALVTLALPPDFEVKFVEGIYEGLNALARRHEVAMAGGETTTNPGRILLSISLLGTVARDKCILRSGAKEGDALFVTGQLGGSRAGHHLDFEPRLNEARWLAEHFPVHAMIDLSDGLAGDLPHLLNTAGLGADLLKTAIPISPAAKLQARAGSAAKPAVLAALTDGEDFELLFTVASPDAVPLLDAWKKQFPDLPLSCIGRITAQPGIRLGDKDGVRTLNVHGYVHFPQS
jgi:thiamine-monophosphate kinase